jgi:hypothetical protein
MRLDAGQIEVIDNETAEMLRQKSGAERLAIADGMFRFARGMIVATLRAEHADRDDRRIAHEAARRLSHGAV